MNLDCLGLAGWSLVSRQARVRLYGSRQRALLLLSGPSPRICGLFRFPGLRPPRN
jgi:hypothetical protein